LGGREIHKEEMGWDISKKGQRRGKRKKAQGQKGSRTPQGIPFQSLKEHDPRDKMQDTSSKDNAKG